MQKNLHRNGAGFEGKVFESVTLQRIGRLLQLPDVSGNERLRGPILGIPRASMIEAFDFGVDSALCYSVKSERASSILSLVCMVMASTTRSMSLALMAL